MSEGKARIFLTGATGFLGSYILRKLLLEGYSDIVCMRRSSSSMDLVADIQEQAQWVEIDLGQTEALMSHLDQRTVVIHAAAMVSFDDRDTQRLYDVNVQGTQSLLHASSLVGVQKFVHVSSVAAVGVVADGERNETHIWKRDEDSTVYSSTKFFSEQEVWRAEAEGLRTVIVNPSIILGAGRWEENSSALFGRVARGAKYFPTGSNGFVDVRDVASATVMLAESDVHGERFILNGANWAYQRLMESTADFMGVDPPSRPIPSGLARLAVFFSKIGASLGLVKEPFSIQAIRALERQEAFSSDKIKKQLGFKFLPLEQTLKESSAAYSRWKETGEWIPLRPY